MEIRTKLNSYLFIFLSILIAGCATSTIILKDINNLVVEQDSSLTIDLNPSEPADSPYTYTITAQPKFGELSVGSDYRHLIYTPFRNYTGPDSFTFEASDGTNKKKAKANVIVNEKFIAGRPMSVRIANLRSPAPGQLKVTWFNSFDIDGEIPDIRYHLYLSTQADFYPSDVTYVGTYVDTFSTTLDGLIEGETYFVAILAEDVDGKFSRSIDKQSIGLIAENITFRSGVKIERVVDLPVTKVDRTIDTIRFEINSPLHSLTGAILQLDQSNGFAYVKIVAPVAISADEHIYSYEIPEPGEFLQDLALAVHVGAYDPASALLEYYQDAAEHLNDTASGNVSVALVGTGVDSATLDYVLSWASLDSIEKLYEYMKGHTSVDVDIRRTESFDCGLDEQEFDLEQEVIKKIFGGSPLVSVSISFECKIGYSIVVEWNNLPYEKPTQFSVAASGYVKPVFDVKGSIGLAVDAEIEIPRKWHFVKNIMLPAGQFPIPCTLVLHPKVAAAFKGDIGPSLNAHLGMSEPFSIGGGYSYTSAGGFTRLAPVEPDNKEDADKYKASLLSWEVDGAKELEITFRVGPELKFNLLNDAYSYKHMDSDGLSTFAMHGGPGFVFTLEAEQNPEVAVDEFDAPLFGISELAFKLVLGVDISLAFNPLDIKSSPDPLNIEWPVFKLPEFELGYEDKAIDSLMFDAYVVNAEGNLAKVVPDSVEWHISEENDAALSIDSNNPLIVHGKWSDQYDANSQLVLEYLPESVNGSIVAESSDLVRSMVKQYEVFLPKFVLEGEWSYMTTYYDSAALELIAQILKLAVEVNPWFSCESEWPLAEGSASFFYDEAFNNYLFKQTITSFGVKMPTFEFDPVVIWKPVCVAVPQSEFPKVSDWSYLSKINVNREMNSEELQAMLESTLPKLDYTSGELGGLLGIYQAAGILDKEDNIKVYSPDHFALIGHAKASFFDIHRYRVDYFRTKKAD